LSEQQIAELFALESARKGLHLTIDLIDEVITDETGLRISFSTDRFRREHLLQGLDDIGITLQYEHKIVEYEKMYRIV
jgi:3-isopropylmalate/(R)-2-methylmalate dehydratase small subunit